MQTIAKTEAIPLRISPFSSTSQVVTWLTSDYGRLATVIKGACRPRRESGGQYDIGYRCELLFYAKSHTGLYMFKACTALDSRMRCRGDWRRTAAMSYICHLAALAAPDGARLPQLFPLVERTLAGLTLHPPPHDTLLLWFELQLLTLLGIAPRLHNCTACGERIAPETGAFFASAAGGIVCDPCAPRHQESGGRLYAGTLACLRRWQRAAAFDPLQTVALSTAQRQTLCRSMHHFMTTHLEFAPECRTIAYQLLTLDIPAHATVTEISRAADPTGRNQT